MKAKDNDTGTFDPIPEDMHLGICVNVIDLGTQHNFKFNKYERKCLLGWELPLVRIEYEEDGETKDGSRMISRRFTLSLGSNAHLRKFLRTWRGRDFTPAELEGFEMKTLLKVGANIQVLHDTSKDGTKVYSNVDSASKLMQGQILPEPEVTPLYFSFDDVSTIEEVDSILDNMPEWIQKLIQKSVEYSDLAKARAAATEVPVGEGVPVPDDDIPF
jgi:hypothetical protein